MLDNIKSNFSFKGVYLYPNINNLSDKNKQKANEFIKIAQKTFPQNDIFLCTDESGEIQMRAQKSNPLHLLVDSEVASQMKMSLTELVSLINFTEYFKSAHDKLWNKEEPYVLDQTTNIDYLDSTDLTYQFCKTIELFNQTHKDIEN